MSQAGTQLTTLPTPVTGSAEQTFYFDDEPVRLFDRDGRPWFAAGDVARIIGHRDAADVTRLLKDDHKDTHRVRTPGGVQAISVISEAGMYRAILMRQAGSKVAASTVARIERFQDWVSGDVLPALRRTGSYSMPAAAPAIPAIDVRDPAQLTAIALQLIQVNQEQALALAETRKALAVVETTVELQAPKVAAFEDLMDDKGHCSLANVARLLDAPQGRFFAWMRKRGIVFDQGESVLPRGDLRRDGYFRVRMLKVSKTRHVEQTLVTRAGLVWLRHRWQVSPDRADLALAAPPIQGHLGL